jgi:hypothetical protein
MTTGYGTMQTMGEEEPRRQQQGRE